MGTLWTLQSSQPNLSMYSAQPLAFGTAYYTLSLGLNIILTALITLRLMIYRRTHLAHLPAQHAKQYLSLATVIIESAALYSAFAIAFLVSYAMNQPINQIWLGFAQAAQVSRTGFRRESECLPQPHVANLHLSHRSPRRNGHGLDEQRNGIAYADVFAPCTARPGHGRPRPQARRAIERTVHVPILRV